MNNPYVGGWFKVLALVWVLALATAVFGQSSAKVYRVGFLAVASPSAGWRAQPYMQAFLDGLRGLGYVEGRNLVIEFRSAESKLDRLPDLAAELVGLKLDVILVGTCGAPLDATLRASRTIPVVVGACTDDLVAAGIAASLQRPGGNVTGLTKLNPELSAKRLELLKQVVPYASRVAVLWDPGYSDFLTDWRALRTAAQPLGVTLLPVEARGAAEFEPAFAAMASERVDAMMTFTDAITYNHPQQVADLAARGRLPAIYPYKEIAVAGGLMSYGPSLPDLFRRSATFIDKILKGAYPGDLPIEQPTKFELVINLKTAKALGLTVPQSLLVRADEVIE